MTLKVQIYSDLHIEFYNSFPKIPIEAEVLILAGDIGIKSKKNYIEFLNYVSNNWKIVFYVLGNHEYYISSNYFDKINQSYHEIFNSFENIILLDNKSYIYNDNNKLYKFIGSTLWANATEFSKNYVNCFNIIKEKRNNRKYPLSVNKFNKMNKTSKQFIIDSLYEEKEDINIILITHYPTIMESSHSKYNTQDILIKKLFANDINIHDLENLNCTNITCISGHTHYSFDFDIKNKNNVRYISNQMGYYDEAVKDETYFKYDGIYFI